ncbi:MAG: hypothetical protein JWL70_3152, partial [Acidimicrobiia bacterium]|nr:hypothetical protein [Acidimicrobiia bacterium]
MLGPGDARYWRTSKPSRRRAPVAIEVLAAFKGCEDACVERVLLSGQVQGRRNDGEGLANRVRVADVAARTLSHIQIEAHQPRRSRAV